MKFKLLPLAIGAVLAVPTTAMADVNVYGKASLTLESVDFDLDGTSSDYSQWELNSNASRIGFKGKEKINDALSAIYKLEYQADVDGDSSSILKQRNIYGGFKGSFGQIIAGKFDTALKKSQGKIDQFGDYQLGDIKNVLKKGENRISNHIQYTTPKSLGPIVAKIGIQPGEGECTTGATDCDDGLADAISASVAYKQDGIYAALAMDSGVKGWDVTRLAFQAKMDMFEAGLIFQAGEESDGSTPDEQEGFVLSGAVKVGPMGKVKAQFGSSEYTETSGSTKSTEETTQIAVGYEHKLSKQTKVVTHYVMLEEEEGNSTDEASTFAVGMVHKF